MRVAWYSNSPWCGTGYGQQTALMLPRLAGRYGADNVAMVSNWGLSGGPMRLGGVIHMPTGYTTYSEDVAPAHVTHFIGDEPGFAITLYDCWPFTNPQWHEIPLVASWCPVDHAPVPPRVLRWFYDFGAIPIAMSRFGEAWLRRAGLEPMYAPHGIDRSVMRPTPKINGVDCRVAFDLPVDRYVVGMVGANKGVVPNRKAFPQAFHAFREFKAERPDALLYVHTDPTGIAGGVDLHRLAEGLGLKVGDDVRFADGYLSRMPLQPEAMAALYTSFDVLLMPSMSEGFGIPALEAQACGVPVIGSDFSAQPELIEAGWLVECEPWFDMAQDAFMVTPNVGSIVSALRDAASRSAGKVTDDAGRAQAHADRYEMGRVWRECWEPILATLEELVPTAAPIKAEPVRRAA